eukprot:gnl/TRDRNA2_/TRDRNA2_175156_c4_seq32.p1 gnl/TRDRNA2_/TRDRNA2_175156_c4~~gnl/TRDRNA2_/TRDRNA2_175156_c4_seq32.p1  ORF type:complete len:1002 (+),score=279.40 gnl/TRDRNA2_/TRDRNA2_175156_c4_seq32:432-3008(+)
MNGDCNDDGEGTGKYKCECYEGFKLDTRSDGSEKCRADQCHGDPCGEGGTCTDLTKQGGPEGSYSCDCEDGFELVKTAEGKDTCVERVCGPLVLVNNLKAKQLSDEADIVITTKDGEPPKKDEFTGMPLLKAFDKAKYTCATGYSTDGTTAPGTKSFVVKCQGTGFFDKGLRKTKECQPVRCDKSLLMSISNAFIPSESDQEDFYEFGDKVTFQCSKGYTKSGEVGAPNTFDIPCEADGHFPKDHPSCYPVSCPIPERVNATTSEAGDADGKVKYDVTVVYICAEGYKVGGDASIDRYEGTCKEDGTFAFNGNPKCEPANCGTPMKHDGAFFLLPEAPSTSFIQQQQARAYRELADAWPEDKPVKFGDAPVTYKCHEGLTVDGIPSGKKTYTVQCSATGDFSETLKSCMAPLYSVTGLVTDAQNAVLGVKEARVKIFDESKKVVGSVLTDNEGMYTMKVPGGMHELSVETYGYVTYTKPLTVTADLAEGQGTNIPLAKDMGMAGYLFVLEWGAYPAHSCDLDPHVYFGMKGLDHVYYDNARAIGGATGGMTASLDRDATCGHGPETISITSADSCTGKNCLITYKVHNFGADFGALGSSAAQVKVYKGDSVIGTFDCPEDVGSDKWWTAFTLDAATGKVYTGAKGYQPYIDTAVVPAQVDWTLSFDYEGWNKVPEFSLVSSISITKLTSLHYIDYAMSKPVRASDNWDCLSVDWNENATGWADCPAGHFLNGFYRTGSRWEWMLNNVYGTKQIDKVWCCKARELKEEWGECKETEAFQQTGDSALVCPDIDDKPTALVGLFRTDDKPYWLSGIKKAKCCLLNDNGLIDVEPTDGAPATTGKCACDEEEESLLQWKVAK